MEESGVQHLREAAGVWRSTILDFMTRQCIYKSTFREEDPYFLIRYRPEENPVNQYHRRAASLCRYGIVMEYYGLSYKDLMELDFDTFENIENEVKQIAEDRAKAGRNRENDLKEIIQHQPKL